MRFGPGAGGGGQGGLSERPPTPSRGAQASSPTPRPPPSVGLNSAVLCGVGAEGESRSAGPSCTPPGPSKGQGSPTCPALASGDLGS